MMILAWNVRHDKTNEYGPFKGVQVTYDLLRDENGDVIATYVPDCQPKPHPLTLSPDGWVFHKDGFIASDFVIDP